MKKRILKIIPYIGIITSVIFMNGCADYESNNIPSGSTDRKEMNEEYNGVSNTATPVTNNSSGDTTKSTQMHPDNTTGVPTTTNTSGK